MNDKIIISVCDFFSEDDKFTKLSDISENWYATAKCPECSQILTIDKTKINNPFKCNCGKNILIKIPEKFI